MSTHHVLILIASRVLDPAVWLAVCVAERQTYTHKYYVRKLLASLVSAPAICLAVCVRETHTQHISRANVGLASRVSDPTMSLAACVCETHMPTNGYPAP